MASNSFGHYLRITTAGESHGRGMGVIVDGCPSGLNVDAAFIQAQLDRRKPGQSAITSQRKEHDIVTIQSGIYQGKTTGAPILMLIPNDDSRPDDYEHLESAFRPSHSDYTYSQKYGIRDHRGGGRSSARETANWVAAGAIAKLILNQAGIEIKAAVTGIGPLRLEKHHSAFDWEFAERHPVRCPDPDMAGQMEVLITEVRDAGDTVGGMVTCVIHGCPVGLGEPVFGKLQANLAHAMLTINACKGFEYGSGFGGAGMRGSEHNDIWVQSEGKAHTTTNYSGGIQGGISNGMPLFFNVAFKPVSTLMRAQQSINVEGESTTVEGKGRHDPCVVPRAVPVVEAMAALVLADHWLWSRSSMPL